MTEVKKERILFWDILKGIGIISIVFGHSQNSGLAIRTVYYYHLAVFFFISGYLYNEERYGDKPFEFFGRRLQNMWLPYVCYGGGFVLLHNFLIQHHLFAGQLYGGRDMLSAMMNTLLLNCAEGPSGALWFVPVMLGTGAAFAAVVWFCRSFVPAKLRSAALGAICLFIGLFGVVLNRRGIGLAYHLQTAVLVLPIYGAGSLLRKRQIDPKRSTAWYGALVSIALFWYFLTIGGESIELSGNVVPGGIRFYIITGAGIYLCCFVAKCLERLPYLGRAAALIGRHSFDIMALHFLVFKGIDGVYGRLLRAPVETYGIFPHSYPELHGVYLVCGVLLPLGAAIIFKWAIHAAGRRLMAWANS